jgi:flagellar hook-associated protein FlgK
MTKSGVAFRILAAGIATILIINYAFRTSKEQGAAEEKITALRIQLNNMRTELNEANAQITTLRGRIEALTGQLASRSEIERQLRKSIPIEVKPERKPSATPGLVTAILYTIGGSSVVIDDEILYEGDTIHGVSITKINQDTVEFAKGAHRWTQRINQTPPRVWTQKNK